MRVKLDFPKLLDLSWVRDTEQMQLNKKKDFDSLRVLSQPTVSQVTSCILVSIIFLQIGLDYCNLIKIHLIEVLNISIHGSEV